MTNEILNGIARTVICVSNNGFRNFRILTLHLVDGVVTAVDQSDPYTAFEAIARLEVLNELDSIRLNGHWKENQILQDKMDAKRPGNSAAMGT